MVLPAVDAGEDHQPATGWLAVAVKGGPTFSVSVEHIHAHSATEVHFGGPIVTDEHDGGWFLLRLTDAP